MPESIVIVGAKRTPIGAMQGKFASLAAPQLGAVAIKAALEQGRAAFLAGHLQCRESLSRATIENAVEWLVSTGLLEEEAGKLRITQAPADLREIIDGMTPYLRS